MHSASLLLLGAGAGLLTTTAGMGGGMLLLVVLSLRFGPHAALACTAPALLLGNLHRFCLFRRELDRRVVLAFAAGAFPGAALGGLLAVAVPRRALALLILLSALLAVARALFRLKWRVPLRAMTPAGLVVGALTATSGGAGVLVGPLFLSAGLGGDAYVATMALSASVLHLGRIVGYGAGGMLDTVALGRALLLACAIPIGNLAGKRLALRERFRPGLVEHATLVACVGLALFGAGR
jgi:uncharacterized protein